MGKDLMEKANKEKEGLEKKCRGPMFLSNAYSNVQSRYLIAPKCSYHDLCKYDYKHVFKASTEITVKAEALPDLELYSVKQNKLKASTEITSGGGPNIFKETITSSAWKVNRQKNMTISKRSRSTKLQSERKNVSLPYKKIDGSAKPAISLKAKVPLVRSIAQLNAARNLENSRNLDRKVSKSFKMLKVGDMNFLKLQNASIYHTIPVHDVVSLKQRKENEGMVANDVNFSMEGDGYISESCVSELSEIENVKSKQRGEDKRTVRKTPSVKLDNSSSLPYKMKFKRGRVIDLRPTENVGPRKLRFRRGRVLDENSNDEALKRLFRKRDKSDMKPPGAKALDNSIEAVTVILRHQDAQEKKDVKTLFNDVIQETASKLFKTRKSKVKSLVGAFETVISLQETKVTQSI